MGPLLSLGVARLALALRIQALAKGYSGVTLELVDTLLEMFNVNPDLSGLPGFLTPHPGLNSGMMMVQVLAAALVSENKTAAFRASVDSIPTPANREDHVSMSTAAARKCRTVVVNATRVLACELLCAAQGLEFLKPLRPGKGAEAAYHHIREQVRPLGRDRTLHRDLEAVERLIRSGSLLSVVEMRCGPLA